MRKFYSLWVIFTLLLYYLGPIDWPGRGRWFMAVLALSSLATFLIGSTVKVPLGSRPRWRFPMPESRLAVNALLAAYLITMSAYLYLVTGRSVVDPTAYSVDFGQVYSDFSRQQAAGTTGVLLTLVILAKSLLLPWVLMLFIRSFGENWRVVAVIGLPMLISSAFRGTDKEVFDLLILTMVAAHLRGKLTRWAVLGAILAVPVLLLFGARRTSRLGSNLSACLPDSVVCFDYNSQVAQLFGRQAEVIYVFMANYLSQGYEGLSHASRLDFRSGFGLSHLLPVRSVVCAAFDSTCARTDYNARLPMTGWDSSTKWSTTYTAIASDVSFWFVPVFTLLLGIAYARCTRYWETDQDPAAGAGIALITIFWCYSSANFQLGISLDWSLATILILYLGGLRRPIRERAPSVRLGGRIAVGQSRARQ